MILRKYIAIAFLPLIFGCSPKDNRATVAKNCFEKQVKSAQFTVCKFPKGTDIQIFHKKETGEIIGTFKALKDEYGDRLLFAMNGGMYLESNDPVGLLMINKAIKKKIFTGNDSGNFGLKPNGVFFVEIDNAGVMETQSFLKYSSKNSVIFATQSGPMLVIDGKIHPKFLSGSNNLNIRNGVGVDDTGNIFFVISKNQTNFHDMASLFKDDLKAKNALYLDGSVSKIYSAELGRADSGDKMGPIIGVLTK